MEASSTETELYPSLPKGEIFMMRSKRVSLWISATLICMGVGLFSGTALAAPKKALAKPTQATQLIQKNQPLTGPSARNASSAIRMKTRHW
jgi:hypothetical protein